MSESEQLIKIIIHYQQSLDRYFKNGNNTKLLHCIFKLFSMPITVSHLQETGIGRTVNALRKMGGEVGDAAKSLVTKWKNMVAEEDRNDNDSDDKTNAKSKVTTDENKSSISNSVHRNDSHSYIDRKGKSKETKNPQSSHRHNKSYKNPDHNNRHSVDHGSKEHITEANVSKSSIKSSKEISSDHDNRDELSSSHEDSVSDMEENHKSEYKTSSLTLVKGKTDSHNSRKRKGDSYLEVEPKINKRNNESRSPPNRNSDSEDNDNLSYETKHSKSDYNSKRRKIPQTHKPADDSDSESSYNMKENTKIKYTKRSRKYEKDSTSDSDSHSSDESETQKKYYQEKTRHKGDVHAHKRIKHENSKSERKSRERSNSSDRKKHKSKSKSTDSSKHGKHSNDSHDTSRHRGEKESRHKHHSKDVCDKKHLEDKHEKRSHSYERSEHRKHRNYDISKENDAKHNDKKTESFKYKCENEDSRVDDREFTNKFGKACKYESSENSPQKVSHIDDTSVELSKSFKSNSNHKSSRDKMDGRSEDKKVKEKENSQHKGRSRDNHRHKSSENSTVIKHESPKVKNKGKFTKEINIGSESGTSFAEALGMLEPSTSKVILKKSKSVIDKLPQERFSNDNENISDENKTELLPLPSKDAIDVDISSLLPSITPNYRPYTSGLLDTQTIRNRLANEDEALSLVMSQKNLRTKVYSGNKIIWTSIPTLFELCTRVLQDNIDALEYTGGVPYLILKPILDKATPEQLFSMEHYNPYLVEDSDELWQLHCQKYFKNKKREELESWRDMYMRCLDEREAKLKALTANIKQSRDKSLPVRQTKLAYVDSNAKPPRNIAKKQAKNGIYKKPSMTPTARINSLSTSSTSQTVPNSGVKISTGNTSAPYLKPKKAPLMQKTLALLKGGRFRRYK